VGNTVQEHFTTSELALELKVQPATIRRSLCVNGHYLGLRPVKLKNHRLLWPTEKAKALLKEAADAA
jgi:hypothetical protein